MQQPSVASSKPDQVTVDRRPTELALRRRPRPVTVTVAARGETSRIVQLHGQLLVCTRQHGSCCCGWDEKGRLPFDPGRLWGDEWERRKLRNRVHLSFTGCLGPCATGNFALLVLHGRTIALHDLNDPDLIPEIYDWIEAMLDVGGLQAPPAALTDHIFERFLPAPDLQRANTLPGPGPDDGPPRPAPGLDRSIT